MVPFAFDKELGEMTKRKLDQKKEDLFTALRLLDRLEASRVICLLVLGVSEALRKKDAVCLRICEDILLRFHALEFCEDWLRSPLLAQLVADATQIDDVRRFTKDERKVRRIRESVSRDALRLLKRPRHNRKKELRGRKAVLRAGAEPRS